MLRRLKTYAGSQGFVYQYYFVGQRAGAERTEYVFDVTSDRKTTYSVGIFLPQNVITAWAASHGRSLTGAEQYAAVKLRLFAAFDGLSDMPSQGRELYIDSSTLESSLATLGVD